LCWGVSGTGRLINPADNPLKDPEILSKGWGPPQFVTTARNHFDNILSFIERPLTNAVGEGINRLQKIVKNQASGFRGLEPFADLIFLTIGDLDILSAFLPIYVRCEG
ncbi:MAG: transposase, partial [Acidiferrobacter sp.]